jgi:head-tail adaptor
MDKKPYIGQKDKRVVISKKTFVPNTIGERKETLVKISDAWAHMQDLSGGEDVEGKVRVLYNRAYIVRWNSEFLAQKSLVIQDGDMKFEVEYVSEIGRKDHLKLVCKSYE